jgi:hypothetical protein
MTYISWALSAARSGVVEGFKRIRAVRNGRSLVLNKVSIVVYALSGESSKLDLRIVISRRSCGMSSSATTSYKGAEKEMKVQPSLELEGP